MPGFNLVSEPWIPCAPLATPNASVPHALSLREALVTAHQQRELLDNSPLVTVALHRLLLALLHRIYRGPASVADWRAIRDARRFDASRIDAYLATWRARFDLFDPQRPFYQVPAMEGVEPGSIAKLAHELASGNNSTLFDHTTTHTAAFTPAAAARYLCAFQLFAGGGGVSQPFNLSDAPLARDYTVLVRGETLFETLLLNLVQYDDTHPFEWLASDDPPWWERDTHPTPDRNGTPPTGYLDYLTWQSRRVHLLYHQESGLVRSAQIRQNLKLASGEYDPFKAYRVSEERGWLSRRFSVERAIWRDSHALFEVAVDAAVVSERRPEVFNWLLQCRKAGIGLWRQASQVDFDVLGSLNDGAQATIILWRHDQLPLPLAYLDDPTLRERLRDALHLAENVSQLFTPNYNKAAKQSYPLRILAAELLTGVSDRDADSADVKRFVAHLGAEQAYWAALDPHFRALLVNLADAMATDGREGGRRAVMAWADQVERCARDIFRGLRVQFDTSGRSLRALTYAERAFNTQLRGLLIANAERFASPVTQAAPPRQDPRQEVSR